MNEESITKKNPSIKVMKSVNDILKNSDIITLHVPKTPSTTNLINADAFKLCKDGVQIINLARGGLIDESALLEALKSGKCAGAALDVYSVEPPNKEMSELINHPNVICTPHLGASTKEAQYVVAKNIANQMSDVFDNIQ